MLKFNPNKETCTGCGACYSACPVKCIAMQRDDEGFLYPYIATDTCVNCGLCERICPMVNKKGPKLQNQKAFAALSRNVHTWRRSASGGAFSEICRVWSDSDTLIVGASWSGNTFEVRHIGVIGYPSILPLCKSKYIASSIGDAFLHIKQHLQQGKKALFCGTPCQVAGLRHFLSKDYENLLSLDLICHGVGSPTVFEQCVKVMEKYERKKIHSYEFRAKRRVHEIDYLTKLSFGDGTCKYVVGDPYIQLFFAQHCLRPSCGRNCIYRTSKRQGDITIADFKGLLQIFPELKGTKRNYSSVVFNTSKGLSIYDKLEKRMKLLPCSIEDIIRFNPLFAKQTIFSEKREEFFSEFNHSPIETIEKWTGPYRQHKVSLKQRIFSLMPVVMRRYCLKILGE